MSQFTRFRFSDDHTHMAKFGDGELVSVLNDNPQQFRDFAADRPERSVSIRRSVDHGVSWSEPTVAFSYPAGPGLTVPRVTIVDREDRLHEFGLRFLASPLNGTGRSKIIHTFSDDRGATWSHVQSIDFGGDYTGALNNGIVLQSGRIVVPLSYYEPQRTSGMFVSVTVYSDDGGLTWNRSNNCAIDGGGQFLESGALEPVVVELNSGLVWMVIRTVKGYLWESFSNDGSVWTSPQPTRIVSSNSPAGVLRLSSGVIALVWSNRYGEPMREGGISYARQDLSLAFSANDGQTWSVPTVIARIDDDDGDDVQTCYPFLIEPADGALIVVYKVIRRAIGRGYHDPIREAIRIEPERMNAFTGQLHLS